MSRRPPALIRRGVCVVVTIAVLGAAVGGVGGAARVEASASTVRLPPEVERLLPPGGRALSGALRVINSLGARNGVYREARQVQSDLKEYYDAQIATARRQLADRELLDLSDSQVATYVRVVERLSRERAAAIEITEREKNDARLEFQGRLVRTISGVLISTPRIRDGMTQLRGAIGELKGAFEVAAAAADGQNPLAAALGPVRERLDRYARITATASVVTGDLGRRLDELVTEARRVIEEYDGASADASAAATGIADRLDGLIGEVDGLLEAGRRARGADDVDAAALALADAFFTPGGEDPSADVSVDAIVRELGLDPSLVEALGVSGGGIDPTTLATMRDRVRGELLRRRTEGIAKRCGAVVGAARRANGGTDDDTPCDVFGDTDRLLEVLTGDDTEPPSTTIAVPDEAPTSSAGQPPPVALTTIPSTTVAPTTSPPTTSPPPPPAPVTTPPPPTTPPRPPELVARVTVTEGVVGQARDIVNIVDVVARYGDGGTANVEFSATSSSSWSQSFSCFFDNDANRPTGDESIVDYRFTGAASGSGTTAAGSDGSLSITLPYEMGGAISASQSVPYTAECAHLNGGPIPDAGPYPGSGEIVITVGSDRSVAVSTSWTGRFGAVRGSG